MLRKNIIYSDIKTIIQITDKGRLLNTTKYSINYRMLKDTAAYWVVSDGRITGCFYFLP